MCITCGHTIHRNHHNTAWSRDFAPVLTCIPGETIHFECLGAGNGHFKRGSTAADVPTLDFFLAAEHGLAPIDASILLSVCGDGRISEVVDQPNWIVAFYFPRIVLS